jgi:hypothetical protein
MKKILVIAAILFSTFIQSQDNNLKISGTVNDLETNTPLEYATISLIDSNNGNLINGVITDD